MRNHRKDSWRKKTDDKRQGLVDAGWSGDEGVKMDENMKKRESKKAKSEGVRKQGCQG